MSEKKQEEWVIEAYNAHASLVRALLFRFGVRTADVEDLTHEVFIKVYQSGEFDKIKSLPSWLCTYARHAAANYRRLKRHEELEFDDVRHGGGDESDHARRALVRDALGTLSDESVSLLTLHHVEGASIAEMQSVFGESKSVLARKVDVAQRMFRQALLNLHQGLEAKERGPLWAPALVLGLDDSFDGIDELLNEGLTKSVGANDASGRFRSVFENVGKRSAALEGGESLAPLGEQAVSSGAAPIAFAGKAIVALGLLATGAVVGFYSNQVQLTSASAKQEQSRVPASLLVEASAEQKVVPTKVLQSVPATESEKEATTKRNVPSRSVVGKAKSENQKSDTSSVLLAEKRLIDSIRNATNGPSPLSALPLIRRHKNEFPSATMAEERDALEIISLAKSGRQGEASIKYQRFEKRFAQSAFSPRMQKVLNTER